MKRFVICVVSILVFAVMANAQYAVPSENSGQGTDNVVSVLKRHRSGMKLDGVKLSAEEQAAILKDIGGIDYTDEWNEYVRKRKLGANLTGIGSGVAAVGATAFVGTGLVYVVGLIFVAPLSSASDDGQKTVDDYTKQFNPWFTGSAIVTGAGAVMTIAGLPMLISNNHKLRKITDEYNRIQQEKAGVQLTLGAAPSGFGFVVTF